MAAISAASLLLNACAETVLQTRTTHYGATYDEIEDQLILINIGEFVDDPNKIPTHIDFKQGTVQATDNLSVGATLPFVPGRSGNNIAVNPEVFNVGAAQIQSQDNWNYQPVTDVDDLVRLRCLYHYVIEQSEPENYGKKYITKDDWTNFTKKKCLVSGQDTVFKYAPPLKPWLTWTEGDVAAPDKGIIDPYGKRLVYLGTFGSHPLWGNLRDFHNFELAVLGSMPNTTGATGSAQTSKPPAPTQPTAALKLSLIPKPRIFSRAEQNIDYSFVVSNTGTVPVTGLNVHDTLNQTITCADEAVAVNAQTVCSATYVTTAKDVAATSVSDGATAFASTALGPITAQDSTTIYLTGHAPAAPAFIQEVIPRQKIPQVTAPGQITYPPFSPGKSSAPIIPPPAPPAQ